MTNSDSYRSDCASEKKASEYFLTTELDINVLKEIFLNSFILVFFVNHIAAQAPLAPYFRVKNLPL